MSGEITGELDACAKLFQTMSEK